MRSKVSENPKRDCKSVILGNAFNSVLDTNDTTGYLVVNKSNSPLYEFRIWNDKIKHVKVFKYLVNVLKFGGKSDTEIRSCIGIVKNTKNLNKLL